MLLEFQMLERINMLLNRKKMVEILNDYYKRHELPFVLAVDFDHTLCYSRFPECGDITPVGKFIQTIQDLHITIILNTCREGESLKRALAWCKENNIRIDYANENDPLRISCYKDCRKIFCNMCIDDTTYDFDMDDFITKPNNKEG